MVHPNETCRQVISRAFGIARQREITLTLFFEGGSSRLIRGIKTVDGLIMSHFPDIKAMWRLEHFIYFRLESGHQPSVRFYHKKLRAPDGE